MLTHSVFCISFQLIIHYYKTVLICRLFDFIFPKTLCSQKTLQLISNFAAAQDILILKKERAPKVIHTPQRFGCSHTFETCSF